MRCEAAVNDGQHKDSCQDEPPVRNEREQSEDWRPHTLDRREAFAEARAGPSARSGAGAMKAGMSFAAMNSAAVAAALFVSS